MEGLSARQYCSAGLLCCFPAGCLNLSSPPPTRAPASTSLSLLQVSHCGKTTLCLGLLGALRAAGIPACLVRTGKYREGDETRIEGDFPVVDDVDSFTAVAYSFGFFKDEVAGTAQCQRLLSLLPCGEDSPSTALVMNYYERELDKLPEKIELLETRVQQLTEEMGQAEFFQQDKDIIVNTQKQLETASTELDACYKRWEQLESAEF